MPRSFLPMIAVLLSVPASADDVELRRFYTESRYGQLHVHHASPKADALNAPPIVLFHQTPLSGRMFLELLPELARGRDVYAIDTPGYGESDPPPAPVGIEEYSAAIGDFLDTLPPTLDLLGYHTGCLIAMELATTREEQVRSVTLVAIPLFDDETRAAYRAKPTEFTESGSHLLEMWESTMRVRADGQTLAQVARIVAEKQRAGERSWWAGPAIFAYDTAAALRLLRQPALVIRPADGLFEHTGNAVGLIRNATLVERDDWGYGFFDSRPKELAGIVRQFLDARSETGSSGSR